MPMKYRTRIFYTEADKALMWDRWRKGDSLGTIGRLLGCRHGSIASVLSKTGGIQPAKRTRSRRVLSLAEREEISRGVVAGQSLRSIAASLGRAPSTISREINRNGGRRRYRANQADKAAWERACRPKTCKLAHNRALASMVAKKLQLQWSPRQIAGWLKRTYPDDEAFQVSHETIYRTLFIQARGALKKELLQHLRRTRAMRRSRHHTQKTADHGRISDTVSIRERPAQVEDRAVPGHWEGDLLFGSNNSQIATLVERHSRYVMIARVIGKPRPASARDAHAGHGAQRRQALPVIRSSGRRQPGSEPAAVLPQRRRVQHERAGGRRGSEYHQLPDAIELRRPPGTAGKTGAPRRHPGTGAH